MSNHNRSYFRDVASASVSNYQNTYGDQFATLCVQLADIIDALLGRFSPHKIESYALSLIIEYALSSVVHLEDIKADIFADALLITDMDNHLLYNPILYGPHLWNEDAIILQPSCYDNYHTEDVNWRIDDLLKCIQIAPRPVPPPRSVNEQILYLYKTVPAFGAWLSRDQLRYELLIRIMERISRAQSLLFEYQLPLPLTYAWDRKVGWFRARRILKSGNQRSFQFLYQIPGDMPAAKDQDDEFKNHFSYMQRFSTIQDDHWVAFDTPRLSSPVALVFGALSDTSPQPEPVRPYPFFIQKAPQEDWAVNMEKTLKLMVVFEGICEQMSAGAGLSCPLFSTNSQCCGFSNLLHKIYELGGYARTVSRLKWEPLISWNPIRWIEPECPA